MNPHPGSSAIQPALSSTGFQPVLDKSAPRIRNMFARIAPWYDFLNHLLSLNFDKRWRRTAVRLVPPDLDNPAPLLDMCTGTGDLALEYDRAAHGRLKIIGADFCAEMLAIAGKKATHRRINERVTFVEADAQNLPFPDDHFQVTTVAFGLRNVMDTDRGLAEMVRVTQPGGRVSVLEFSRPTAPIFGALYAWYFRSVLPRVGQLISRSPDSAYRYLPESVSSFPDGERLAAKMRDQGLIEVVFYPLTLGIATLYVGKKAK